MTDTYPREEIILVIVDAAMVSRYNHLVRHPAKIAVILLSLGLSIALYRASHVLNANVAVAQTVPPTQSRPASATKPSAVAMATSAASTSVIAPDDARWALRTQAPAEAAITDTVADDLPANNKHAVHVQVTTVDPKKFWAAQIIKQVPQEVHASRSMTVHFWGRSAQHTPVWVIFEEGKPPHTPELQQKVTFSPEWKQYEIPFRTTREHVKPHANFCIKAGIQPGEIEVAGIYVDEL